MQMLRTEMKPEAAPTCTEKPATAFEKSRDRCLEHLAAAKRRLDTMSEDYAFSPVETLFEFTVSAAQMADVSRVPSTLLDAIAALEVELEVSGPAGFVLARVLLERAAVFAQEMCDAAGKKAD